MAGQPITWNFGKLEARLAAVNRIADSKRTAFQARLKNLHRLRFPLGFKLRKGKAAVYEPGEIMMMGLAVEMTQLGLSPEMIVKTLAYNWQTASRALLVATRGQLALLTGEEEGDEQAPPLPVFAFFDPVALAPLTLDFEAGGPASTWDTPYSFYFADLETIGVVLMDPVFTSGHRLSLINVSTLLARMIDDPFKDQGQNLEYRYKFYRDVERWADRNSKPLLADYGKFLRDWMTILLYPHYFEEYFDDDLKFVCKMLGMKEREVVQSLRSFRGLEHVDVDPQA